MTSLPGTQSGMDETVSMFLLGQDAFGARVNAVTEQQWTAPTPDTEWRVADLVSHLVTEHQWAPPLLHGLDLESAGKVVEGTRSLPVGGGVGANLAQEWNEAAVASADAVRAEGVAERTVALARGDTPARQYLTEMSFDLLVHSWDLGVAIGYADPLPGKLVEYVYAAVKEFGDLSASGLFAKPVNVADDAPLIDKLVALTGRDPANPLRPEARAS